VRVVVASKAAGGHAPALECGSPSLREGFPALLDHMARRESRYAHCVRYARTISASQMLKRALRARGHALCAARRRICRCRRTPAHGFAGTSEVFIDENPGRAARWAVPGGGDLWGGEKRSIAVGARTARASTSDSPRLFEHNERSEWSEFRGATAMRASQRSRSEAQTAPV